MNDRSVKRTWKILIGVFVVMAVAIGVAWFGFLKPEPPPVSDKDRAHISLIPLPAEMKLHRGELFLSGLPVCEFRGVSTPRLERAADRFLERLENQTGLEPDPVQGGPETDPVQGGPETDPVQGGPETDPARGRPETDPVQGGPETDPARGRPGKEHIPRLVLKCHGNSTEFPSAGDDESYSLKVTRKKLILEAPSETGIIFGLETLLQLIYQDEGVWKIPALSMKDRPRYTWRGLMIDACRHWIPKEVILRNLDGMAAVKMNVLHWHLTENQAFRVESKIFPRLQVLGSNGNYYTQEEIREVVDYAADRGIRVIPEFDLPGHSTSWFVGYPELASAPGPYVTDTILGVVLKPLMDPTREEVYNFLDRFLGEMSTLFPDKYIHIGGEEVATTQWDENPRIQQFMKDHNLDDPTALQAYFIIRLREILENHGKKMMGWEEILHPDLPSEGIVVQSWKDHSSLWEAARKGNRAVLSAGYYLDFKFSAGYHYKVDPAVIPGAINIEIDSANWKGWDFSLEVMDMTVTASLYLFGEGEEKQGIMTFMEGTFGLNDIVAEGNHLAFTIESNYGNIKFETDTEGDSITGEAGISMFKLILHGSRSGGTDMAGGKPLPRFTMIEPLTREQKKNLTGGEACIWSEMVDATTMESRVWPRAAAIAEKLWSPFALTGNTEDMYRRLLILDDRLEGRGLKHRSYREEMLRDWAGEPYTEPLQTLVSLLQEDQVFNRMIIYHPQLYTTTPLDRVVDAAPAESYRAYRFGQAVNRWLETGDEETGTWLKETLESWSVNHDQLAQLFASSPLLQEVEPHSVHLSALARLGLDVLAGEPVPLNDSIRTTLIEEAKSPYGGTLLKVVEPVQKLVAGAAGK